MKKCLTLLSFILLVASPAFSDNPPQPETFDLSWMVGNWTGDAFGGKCEESWQPMSAGTMCGTYKQINKDKVNFYEFTVIKKETDGYSLKLKHFNPDMTGWEEKDKVIEFPFISLTENLMMMVMAVWMIDDNHMKVTVNIGHSEGTVNQVTIELNRVK